MRTCGAGECDALRLPANSLSPCTYALIKGIRSSPSVSFALASFHQSAAAMSGTKVRTSPNSVDSTIERSSPRRSTSQTFFLAVAGCRERDDHPDRSRRRVKYNRMILANIILLSLTAFTFVPAAPLSSHLTASSFTR